MTHVFDPVPAAALLAKAWQEGRQFDEIPANIRPQSLREGYALQKAFIQAHLAQTGDQEAGWKLGVGSVAAMRAAGTDRPLMGRLLKKHCHDTDSTVKIVCQAPITVEFEIAFVLGRDIAPGTAPADPMRAVASTHIAFELVLSRFINRRTVDGPSFVGDNLGFEASILGPQIDPATITRGVASVSVQAHGKPMAGGLNGEDGVDPVLALRYLFEYAYDEGITLRSGDRITTGAVAKPFDIMPGETSLSAVFLGKTLTTNVIPARI